MNYWRAFVCVLGHVHTRHKLREPRVLNASHSETHQYTRNLQQPAYNDKLTEILQNNITEYQNLFVVKYRHQTFDEISHDQVWMWPHLLHKFQTKKASLPQNIGEIPNLTVLRESKEHLAVTSRNSGYEWNPKGRKYSLNEKFKTIFASFYWLQSQTHPKNCSKDGALNTFGAVRSGLVGDMWSWYLMNLCNK